MREEGDSRRRRRGEQEEANARRQTDPHFLPNADSGSEHTHTHMQAGRRETVSGKEGVRGREGGAWKGERGKYWQFILILGMKTINKPIILYAPLKSIKMN